MSNHLSKEVCKRPLLYGIILGFVLGASVVFTLAPKQVIYVVEAIPVSE